MSRAVLERVAALAGEEILRNDPHAHAALTHAMHQGLSVEETLALMVRVQTAAKDAALGAALDLARFGPAPVVISGDLKWRAP